MGKRQINFLLWSVAAVCGATGVAITVGLLVAPLDLPAAVGDAPAHHKVSQLRLTVASAAEDSLIGRSFRAGSIAAASLTAPAAAPANDLSAVQLVGTIGDSIAMLRGPDGTTALVEVGDDVNGAAVIAIRPLQIDLKLKGRKTTLVKSDSSDSNAADPNAAAWPSQP